MYTALTLYPQEQQKLIALFRNIIPLEFEIIAHHMTINMGEFHSGPAADLIETDQQITLTTLAKNELVMAVGIETVVPSTNSVKHITLAVNRQKGGKPFHSNQLTNWTPLTSNQKIVLIGKVQVEQ